MSIAYEQSTLTTVGARARKLVLGFVMGASLFVNLVFAVSSLNNAASAYALLAFGLFLAIIGWLIDYTLADAEEVAEAVLTNIHPALLRAPVCISYEWVVGTWLAWWFVTQLLFQADIVYEHSLIGAFTLTPLLIATIAVRLLAAPLHIGSRVENWLLIATQLLTYTLFFFPSHAWAPQYIGVFLVSVRVVLFYTAVLLLVFLEPPQWDVSLDESAPVHDIEKELSALLRGNLRDIEQNTNKQQLMRYERARSMLAAHARITREHRRMRTFVAQTAWLLYLPLQLIVVLYPLFCAASIYDAAKNSHRRTLTLPQPTPAPESTPPPPLYDTEIEEQKQALPKPTVRTSAQTRTASPSRSALMSPLAAVQGNHIMKH